MTHVPSWTMEVHPRNCAGCGETCRKLSDKIGWAYHRRELCPGCLEMFCKTCAQEHRLFGCDHEKGPVCGKDAKDHPDVPLPERRWSCDVAPGWKVAFLKKVIPGIVVTSYSVHTAGWDMAFFIGMNDPEAGTIDRQAMEEICEALKCFWTAYPAAAVVARSKEAKPG